MQRVLLVLFIMTVALAPVPLGSNRDSAWAPLAAIVGGLLIGMAATVFANAERARRAVGPFRALLVPAVLFSVVVAWGLVQLSGWTPAEWASPLSANSTFGIAEAKGSIAFDREQQWTALLRLLTYAGVFLLAACLANSASDARRILAAIVVVATISTAYAMAAEVINSQSRVTGFTAWVPHELVFSGTFVNGNNYATYAGVAAMAALVLAFRPGSPHERRESRGERWRRRIGEITGLRGVWLALAIMLCMGVVLSASRAAVVSLALALMAMVAFYARGLPRIVFSILIPLLVATVAVFTPGGSKLAMRTATLIAEGESGREGLFPMTVHAIGLRPMTGWGMNSFEKLYGMFQPPELFNYFDKAHNTYLELAFDLGIPAAVTLVLAVAWIVARCLTGFMTRGRDRELAGLGVFATVLAGFHALFDFSLQIPGMTCTYCAILGVAWAQSWSSRAENPI